MTEFKKLSKEELNDVSGGGLLAGAIGFVGGGVIGAVVGFYGGAIAYVSGSSEETAKDIFVTCTGLGAAIGGTVGLTSNPL